MASCFNGAAILGLIASADLGTFADAAQAHLKPAFSERAPSVLRSFCSEPIPEYLPLYLVLRRDTWDHSLLPGNGGWWEDRIDASNVTDINDWPFGHLLKGECGSVVWLAGERLRA